MVERQLLRLGVESSASHRGEPALRTLTSAPILLRLQVDQWVGTWLERRSRGSSNCLLKRIATNPRQMGGEALVSLKRCKPAGAPIYHDGDLYALDSHDDEVTFWLFRLGLRPARGAPVRTIQHSYGPRPSTDHPVPVAALDEAWRDGVPNSWSAQRVDGSQGTG